MNAFVHPTVIYRSSRPGDCPGEVAAQHPRPTFWHPQVDDYGTGYSSLAYLQELAVDELKLDKSFVMRMTEDPGAAAIVRPTVDLAHSLGLTMVAEGVENEAALAELARLGCDLAQGYHISRPLPAEQLTGWLQARIQQQPMRSHVAPVMGTPS
jgi:sensor c-di-GMP phosphodiesterase-like protein